MPLANTFVSLAHMECAIELAKKGLNTTTPNPRVGCVIVKNGEIIGEGFHEKSGLPHAEVNALNDARKNGYETHGATAYVTLEPCSHHGKTPPCADALIKADIAKVVVGSRDPNPEVSGRGVKKLRDAGITVIEDVMRDTCDELNLGFFKRMTYGLPWVTVKLGMTLDAKIATASGESQWITGKAAREDVQHLRARACAVVTSAETVIADNPSLNVRLAGLERQPKRVIFDSRLRTSTDAKIFSLAGDVLVYTCSQAQFNSQTIVVPDYKGHANLKAVLHDLAQHQGCNEVLVEAGGRFVGALLDEDLVDELVIYSAPMLLGEGARPAFSFLSVGKLADAKRFSIHDCVIINDDLKITYRR